jgi:hypothetical protein
MANWFESRAETMTETEAKSYFTEPSYPHPGPGETWGEAIKRAYLADVTRAAEMIPRLGPEAARGALTAIFEGVDPPAAIFKAAHDHGVVYLESSGKPQSPWTVKD